MSNFGFLPSPPGEGRGEGLRETETTLSVFSANPGREVWHNFWETRLTHKVSYLARLNYVHQNPVKHGLVAVANQYPWCSAEWFERTARPAQVKTICGFNIDQLRVLDDYDVAGEW